MKFKRTTKTTVIAHLRAFADWLEENGKPTDRAEVANSLNDILDGLYFDDAFGTEGQTDPRGDHRG